MSVQAQKNVMNVLVGGATTNYETIANLVTYSATQDVTTYLPEGQVVVMGMNPVTGKELVIAVGATSATYPSIRFAVKNDGVVNYSNRMFASDVVDAKKKAYVAPAEQITYVGFNGTTGSIDATNVDREITFVGDWDYALWSQQKYRKNFDYYSLTPTQQSIAQNISTLMNLDQYNATLQGTGAVFKCEVLNSGSAASTTYATATNAAVVNGSDIVLFTNGGAAADFSTSVVVGSVLRLGGTYSSTTVPVYVVTEVNNTAAAVNGLPAYSIRLHTPYQGTTDAAMTALNGSIGGGDGGLFATVGTDWGLKVTGKSLTWGIPPYSDFKYIKVSFHFDLLNWGNTTLTESTRATRGNGTYQEVAEYEYWSQGNEGALNRTVIPLPTGRKYVTTTNSAITDYDTVCVTNVNTQSFSPITGPTGMRAQNYVFFVKVATSDNITLFLSQLNPWLNSIPANIANI